jgi:ammonium transporter Rh
LLILYTTAIQFGILVEGFFKNVYHDHWGYIKVDAFAFIDSLFLAAAILISFGGVIGKVSPLQIIVMTLLETVFYSVNKGSVSHT